MTEIWLLFPLQRFQFFLHRSSSLFEDHHLRLPVACSGQLLFQLLFCLHLFGNLTYIPLLELGICLDTLPDHLQTSVDLRKRTKTHILSVCGSNAGTKYSMTS